MVRLDGYAGIHGPEINTRTVVSQKARIFSFSSGTQDADKNPLNQIGVLSSFGITENRTIESMRGIGFGDRIAELVPGVTSEVQISVSRVALWLSNLFQSFGYNGGVDGIVRSLRHHKWPFDIRQELVFSEIGPSTAGNLDSVIDFGPIAPKSTKTKISDSKVNGVGVVEITPKDTPALITFYEGCWMSSFGVSFEAGSAVVTENCSISCSDITAGNPGDIISYFNEVSLAKTAFRVKS